MPRVFKILAHLQFNAWTLAKLPQGLQLHQHSLLLFQIGVLQLSAKTAEDEETISVLIILILVSDHLHVFQLHLVALRLSKL